MLTDLSLMMYSFVRLFRRMPPIPFQILVPGLVIVISWPLLRIGFDDARAAFMVSFVAAMALRLAMQADNNIRSTRVHLSAQSTVALTLILGPGVLGLMILAADPMLCQRFLSLYFLVIAALYIIDVVDGRSTLVRHFWPDPQMRAGDATMTRVMAVYNLAMVLLNETVMQTASQTTWLLYFGLLPLLSHVVMTALVRTVRTGFGGQASA